MIMDLNVELGDDDAMLSEYENRSKDGLVLPIDRANAAAQKAVESHPMAIEAEREAGQTAYVDKVLRRTLRLARLTALAESAADNADNDSERTIKRRLAEESANLAEGEALILSAFDSARLN